MENIWAPWRLKYILDNKHDDECFLCKSVNASADNDEDNLIIYRGQKVFAILNRYPYNNGHVLIAPNTHVGQLEELDEETLLEISTLTVKIKKLHDENLAPDGYNMGYNFGRVAGAGVPGHLHFHIVPRWTGDTNFMPVVSDIKVVPQSLTELCRLLRRKIK